MPKILTQGKAFNPQQQFGMLQQQYNPYSILDNNLNALQDYYKDKIKTLQGYDLQPDQYNQIITGWQEEYDKRKFNIISARLQLDDIKLGMEAGKIDSATGEQAMMELVLPEDTYKILYPEQMQRQQAPLRKQFDPKQVDTFVKEFAATGQEAIVNPLGWGKSQRKYVDKDKLVELYNQNKIIYNYDIYDANTQRSFDTIWKIAMRQNPLTAKAWKEIEETNPDVYMNQTYGSKLLNGAKQAATGQPVSPMVDALQKKPTYKYHTPMYGLAGVSVPIQVSKTDKPTPEELEQQNTREAYEKGKQLGYWK